MKNIWLKITVVAACSMLSASAWATDEPGDGNISANETGRSSSIKHLSATGRTTDHSVRASRLTGASIQDSSGNRIGQIQDIVVNPSSGRIEFGIISLTSAGAAGSATSIASSGGKMIPVPWSLLKPAAQSEYSTTSAGQQPSFRLNVDQDKLSQAPTIERSSSSEVGQSEWRQRIYSYYGVSEDAAAGGAESPAGTMKGHEAEKLIDNDKASDKP